MTREIFGEQVKDMLVHLYDVAYLPQLELTCLLAGDSSLSWEERAQAARRVIVQAIERLDPGPHFPLTARVRRSYAILFNRYARSMTSQEVREELAISERQYWREHKKALETLAQLLWNEYSLNLSEHAELPSTSQDPATVAQTEAALMASHSHPEEISAKEVLHQAARALQKVAESKGIEIQMDVADPPPLVFADRTVLRQVFLIILSYALDITVNRCISVQVRETPEAVWLTVTTMSEAGRRIPAGRIGLGLDIARQLVEAQDGQMQVQVGGESGLWVVSASLPKAKRIPILVIDDNNAIINLFQRYLARSKYQVVGAESGRKGLLLASQIKPAAITLDVMMPSQDGWETLQALKAIPQLQGIPVIVCSILNEPDLAYALGADDFLRKPISQSALLQTLDRWLARPREGNQRYPAVPADSETVQPS